MDEALEQLLAALKDLRVSMQDNLEKIEAITKEITNHD